jgi:hypothetical protein
MDFEIDLDADGASGRVDPDYLLIPLGTRRGFARLGKSAPRAADDLSGDGVGAGERFTPAAQL